MTIPPPLFLFLCVVFIGLSFASILLLTLSFLTHRKPFIQYRPLLFTLALGCLITYLASLISVFIAPYWMDNGVQEAIVFPQHFGWAFFAAPVFQVIIMPIVIIGMRIISFRK